MNQNYLIDFIIEKIGIQKRFRKKKDKFQYSKQTSYFVGYISIIFEYFFKNQFINLGIYQAQQFTPISLSLSHSNPYIKYPIE
jgi:hypothetical protein